MEKLYPNSPYYAEYKLVLDFIEKNVFSLFNQKLKYPDYFEHTITSDKISIRATSEDYKINFDVIRDIKFMRAVIASKVRVYEMYLKLNASSDIYFENSDGPSLTVNLLNKDIVYKYFYENRRLTKSIHEDYLTEITTTYHTTEAYDKKEFHRYKVSYTLNITKFFKNEKLHNKEGEPAVIEIFMDRKTLQYFKNGKLSRDKHPAYIETHKENKPILVKFALDDKFHNESGPAYLLNEVSTGNPLMKLWYVNNKLHNEDGPAYIEYYATTDLEAKIGAKNKKKTVHYFSKGLLHRDKKPAVIFYDRYENVIAEEYYKHGKKYTAKGGKATAKGDGGKENQVCPKKYNDEKIVFLINSELSDKSICVSCVEISEFLKRSPTIKKKNLQFTDILNRVNSVKIYDEWVDENKEMMRVTSTPTPKGGKGRVSKGDIEMVDAKELSSRFKSEFSLVKFTKLIESYKKYMNDCLDADFKKVKYIEIEEFETDAAIVISGGEDGGLQFISGDCKGLENTKGVCWANSLLQFIAPISKNIKYKDIESAIAKLCPSKKENLKGGGSYQYIEFLGNVQKELNSIKGNSMDVFVENYEVIDYTNKKNPKYVVFLNVTNPATIFLSLRKNVNFNVNLGLNVKQAFDINSTYSLESVLLEIPNHVMCIRNCKDEFGNSRYHLFNDKEVVFIPHDLIELFGDNPSLILSVSNNFKDISNKQIKIAALLFSKFVN